MRLNFTMAIMYPNLLQVVTLKKSDITDIEQVKGRNISTGSPETIKYLKEKGIDVPEQLTP